MNNNYSMIDFIENYDMKNISSKVSCNNMSSLSSKYTFNQNKIFSDKINTDLCDIHNNYNDNVDNIKKNESDIIRGIYIDNKTCIYKRPLYEEGDWINQYVLSDMYKDELSNMNSHTLFDYQSKAKVTKTITKKCPIPNNFKILGECPIGPHKTFTNTFTNNFNNCV